VRRGLYYSTGGLLILEKLKDVESNLDQQTLTPQLAKKNRNLTQITPYKIFGHMFDYYYQCFY